MTKLKKWMQTASPAENEALAALAGTTVGSLRQAAGGYRQGSMKAGLAGRIAKAAEQIRKVNPALPALSRADLCGACAKCEYFKR